MRQWHWGWEYKKKPQHVTQPTGCCKTPGSMHGCFEAYWIFLFLLSVFSSPLVPAVISARTLVALVFVFVFVLLTLFVFVSSSFSWPRLSQENQPRALFVFIFVFVFVICTCISLCVCSWAAVFTPSQDLGSHKTQAAENQPRTLFPENQRQPLFRHFANYHRDSVHKLPLFLSPNVSKRFLFVRRQTSRERQSRD